MNAFRVLLAVIFLAILVYTVIVIGDHGMNLFAVFFGDMAQLNWPGQFNLDFFCMLILSATWTAWRNDFSLGGLVLAVMALNLGAPFLSAYLMILSFRTNGDVKRMLLGDRRAAI